MENIYLEPVKGIEDYVRKLYNHHYIYYTRKGKYAECKCSECGKTYLIRTESTGDPFEDDLARVEKPARDVYTKCRQCSTKAIYKPAHHTKSEWHFERICVGQKIDDEHFVFRIFYSEQRIKQNCETLYGCSEDKRIFLEKGKKPSRYDNYAYYENDWHTGGTGENWYYKIHPKTYREIAKTGMFKYVPVVPTIMHHWREDCGIIDYYIAAARYPDFEMIIKMGLIEYADDLVRKVPVNPNPRGKTIEDRLRINKDRIKDLIACKGQRRYLFLYQNERKLGAHWTDEELAIIKDLRDHTFANEWNNKVLKVLQHVSPIRLKNYMKKQKMWIPGEKEPYNSQRRKNDLRREYFDYLLMRADEGYDMTNDIILYPADFVRRRDEMLLQVEKAKQDKRKKEVLEKFPKIKSKYRRLSEKYSAAAGGYIIRPAKDAAEIVEEGRVLHHCVGGDSYLSSHNYGNSFILFLREADKKDIPFVTVEIRGEEIRQWYGAYDEKPNQNLIDAWLKTYTRELKKHKEKPKKASCTGTTKTRRTV